LRWFSGIQDTDVFNVIPVFEEVSTGVLHATFKEIDCRLVGLVSGLGFFGFDFE